MDKPLRIIDWTQIQVFTAVAEAGSLSAAARRLAISQPTAGRQIRQLEERLGTSLFRRQSHGLSLTDAGAALLPHALAMRDGAAGLALTAAGQSPDAGGTVRVTASVFVATYILPGIVARLRQSSPEITIEIVPNDASDNLLFREADIAVRMYRPDQLDVVTRHLGDVEMGIYAARDYLDRAGSPDSLENALKLDVIGYDTLSLIVDGLGAAGIQKRREDFPVRTDGHAVYFELLRAGCGIGFAQARVADRYPELVRLFPETPVPSLPLWLAAHDTLRRVPRLRRVWSALETGLAEWVS